jgi:hypothetical protein
MSVVALVFRHTSTTPELHTTPLPGDEVLVYDDILEDTVAAYLRAGAGGQLQWCELVTGDPLPMPVMWTAKPYPPGKNAPQWYEL